MKAPREVPWCRRTIFFFNHCKVLSRAMCGRMQVGCRPFKHNCKSYRVYGPTVPHCHMQVSRWNQSFSPAATILEFVQSLFFIFDEFNWVREGCGSENILCDYQKLCGVQHRRWWSSSYQWNVSRWLLHYDQCGTSIFSVNVSTSGRVLIAFEFHISMRAYRVHKFIQMDSKPFCASRR